MQGVSFRKISLLNGQLPRNRLPIMLSQVRLVNYYYVFDKIK
jgi:hypothetical protein